MEWRTIRVFVSSTFRDMQAERDILIKKIFPQLRKMCEERAVAWTEVDLRWGITTEEVAEGKVLPLCLAEIERCRPYFIGLLGERYGWVPESIPQELLDSEEWLKEHLQHSVTELEILHGVLRNPAMADRSLFYFRDPHYVNSIPDKEKPDFICEGEASHTKLAHLKERICAAHKSGQLLYQPRENYPGPDAFGEMVLKDFTAIIDQLFPKRQIPDPLDQEAARHEAYGQHRRLAFVGREDLLRKMNDHVNAQAAKPLVLTGESGCGKSALLAEWVRCWRDEHRDDLIIQHYIGSTPESTDWQGLVRRILGELKRAFSITDELPMQPEALRNALNDWAVKASGKRRVVLVLDALNQLADDPAAKQLGWLPFAFPANFRVLVSSLPGESLDALSKRKNWPELEVPLFSKSDIAPAAEAYFTLFSKKLPKDILSRLKAAPAAANALYLRVVLDELRQFGKHEGLTAKVAEYLAAPDLPELFDRILARWHGDFGQDKEYPDLIRRSLCLIACARFGLSESELLGLLGKKNEKGEDEPLPRRYWTPFYLAAESALALRAGLLNFGHDYLRRAVERRFLKSIDDWDNVKLLLADYFEKIPEPTPRKLDELPKLLLDTECFQKLVNFLSDLETFLKLRSSERWKWDLHGYWLALMEGNYDPVEIYQQALSAAEQYMSAERLADALNQVAHFHHDAGRYTAAESLYLRAVEARERVLGPEHPHTLLVVYNLASLLKDKGDYAGAELFLRRALEGFERTLGLDADTLANVNPFAISLYSKGDYASLNFHGT